jgi:hypothetical protein
VETLQQSALELLDALCNVGRTPESTTNPRDVA